jgi:cellulose biosynthesis protein BcsQ
MLASRPDVLSTARFFQEVVGEVATMKGCVSGAILFTMLKTGTVFNLSGQEQIKEFGYPVCDTALYYRITYQEAISQGMRVAEYNPGSKAAQKYAISFTSCRRDFDKKI